MIAKRNTLHFVKDWYKSDLSIDIMKNIYLKNSFSSIIRKKYAFMECPHIDDLKIFTFKIALVGNENVGKSSFAERLCGQNIHNTTSSFRGISVNKVYIPFQLDCDKKVVLICFEIWDCNSKAMENNSYMKESLVENIDGILYIFSMSQQSSFEDLSRLISRTLNGEQRSQICQFVIATKVDLYGYLEVTQREVQEFGEIWKLPIFFVSNVISNLDFECRHGKRDHPPFCQEIELLMPLFEKMADDLWNRQQTKEHV